MKSQKGNIVIWILVIVVILIGIYFVKNSGTNKEFNYTTNTTNNTEQTGTTSEVSGNTDLSAEFNSADSDFNGIDVEGMDEGL